MHTMGLSNVVSTQTAQTRQYEAHLNLLENILS